MESLRTELESLKEKMLSAVQERSAEIKDLHPGQRASAINLIEYLTLRSEDLRALQDRLHSAGLSSLTSSESHVLRQVQAILQWFEKKPSPEGLSSLDYYKGRDLIQVRSSQLFGIKKDVAVPFLMVTFDKTFADNYQLVKKLLEAGMNIARINCAHDDEDTWKNLIDLVSQASERTGIPCKIYMDLGGPKMRAAILGRGRSDERIALVEGLEINLAEKDADYDPSGIVIGCDEPGIVKQLRSGERIIFDDGLIEGRILSSANGIAHLKISRVSSIKPQLKSGKGINFPDTDLRLAALTDHDRRSLPFICEHASLVGYSFIRHASDLEVLQKELSAYSRKPEIILKIETSEAVKNLPSILMQGMKQEVFGLMIARGDLAVEIGFERLSEIQDEIIWISEAAHVPLIWATQVLETLNKSGIATRSEVTDASHAAQCECVMIYTGDYGVVVLRSLSDILRRSGGHHVKKRFTFRPLKIASDYLAGGTTGPGEIITRPEISRVSR